MKFTITEIGTYKTKCGGAVKITKHYPDVDFWEDEHGNKYTSSGELLYDRLWQKEQAGDRHDIDGKWIWIDESAPLSKSGILKSEMQQRALHNPSEIILRGGDYPGRIDLEKYSKSPMVKALEQAKKPDMVNHPPHYTAHPSGIECIEITRHMGFNLGNAIKYIWRADEKDNAITDIKKAIWYLQDELKKREENNAEQ